MWSLNASAFQDKLQSPKADLLQDFTEFPTSAKSQCCKFTPVKLSLNMQLFSSVHTVEYYESYCMRNMNNNLQLSRK